MKNCALLLLFCLLFDKISAQSVDFPFIESARNLALANATTASVWQNNAMCNPATLAFLPKNATVFATIATPYFLEDWKKMTLAASYPAGNTGHFSLILAQSGIQIFTQKNMRLAYGRLIGAKLSVGAVADFSSILVPDYGKTSSVSVGFGLLWHPKPALHVGFSIQNPTASGWKTGESRTPNMRSGAAWQVNSQVQFLVELEKDLRNAAVVKIALEYQILNKIILRSGLRNAPFRWAFGGGYRLQKRILIDFATEWNPALGITPAVSVGYNFLEKKKK